MNRKEIERKMDTCEKVLKACLGGMLSCVGVIVICIAIAVKDKLFRGYPARIVTIQAVINILGIIVISIPTLVMSHIYQKEWFKARD